LTLLNKQHSTLPGSPPAAAAGRRGRRTQLRPWGGTPPPFPLLSPFSPATEAFLPASRYDEAPQQRSSAVPLLRHPPTARSSPHIRLTGHIWHICRKQTPGAQQQEPDSFQGCPATGQGAMGRN